jgi:hypothetical protein
MKTSIIIDFFFQLLKLKKWEEEGILISFMRVALRKKNFFKHFLVFIESEDFVCHLISFCTIKHILERRKIGGIK